MIGKKGRRFVKQLLTAALGAALLLTNISSPSWLPGAGVDTVQAAVLSHVKATASDYVQGNAVNLKGVQGTEMADQGESPC